VMSSSAWFSSAEQRLELDMGRETAVRKSGGLNRGRRAVRKNWELNRGKRCDVMWVLPHHPPAEKREVNL